MLALMVAASFCSAFFGGTKDIADSRFPAPKKLFFREGFGAALARLAGGKRCSKVKYGKMCYI